MRPNDLFLLNVCSEEWVKIDPYFASKASGLNLNLNCICTYLVLREAHDCLEGK